MESVSKHTVAVISVSHTLCVACETIGKVGFCILLSCARITSKWKQYIVVQAPNQNTSLGLLCAFVGAGSS